MKLPKGSDGRYLNMKTLPKKSDAISFNKKPSIRINDPDHHYSNINISPRFGFWK